MKHLFTVLFIVCIAGLAKGAELKGKILLAHDTLDVTLKVPLSLFNRQPVLHNLRSKIVYFDKKGQRKVLNAKEAKEVIFSFENDTIHLVSRPHPFSINKRKPRFYFLRLVEDGSPLKLFIFYDETTSDDGMNTDYVERYFVEKNNQELILASGLNFRKIMLEIVGDCPEIAQKIESREWRKRDLVKIVRFYNNQCERE